MSPHARQAVVVRVADRVLAIPVEHVIETMRPLPITAPAPAADGSAGSALGQARIRGAPCPVVDLARRLGLTDPAPPSRFVVVRGARGPVALQVAAVVEVGALGDGPPLAVPAAAVDDGLGRVWSDARWAHALHGVGEAAETPAVS